LDCKIFPLRWSPATTCCPLADAIAKSYTLKDLEKEYIMRAMETVGGNKTEAAKI
jgi:hypothetical protein